MARLETFPGVATEWVRDYFRERVLARRSGLAPLPEAPLADVGYDAARVGLNQRFATSERKCSTAPLTQCGCSSELSLHSTESNS